MMRLRYSVDDVDYRRDVGLACVDWMDREGIPSAYVTAIELSGEGQALVTHVDWEATMKAAGDPVVYEVVYRVASLPPWLAS